MKHLAATTILTLATMATSSALAQQFADMTASTPATPVSAISIVTLMCWFFAMPYLLIAALNISRAIYQRLKTRSSAMQWNCAWFFVIAGGFLLAFPYFNTLFQVRIRDADSATPVIDALSRSGIFKSAMLSMLAVSPLLPWAMLAMNKTDARLKKYGRYGLFAALVPYCLFAILLIL